MPPATRPSLYDRSYCHRGGDPPLLGATIPTHFATVAEQYSDRDAVVCVHQQRRLSYAEFASATDQLARGLLGQGFGPGDRVGIWSTNNIEWLLLQMATARIGAILVNINPAYRPQELAYALQRSEVQGLFVIPEFRASNYVDMLLELIPGLGVQPPDGLTCEELPQLRRVAIYDPTAPLETKRPHPGFTTWAHSVHLGHHRFSKGGGADPPQYSE
jgi:fatty-acyl-CoA synthase